MIFPVQCIAMIISEEDDCPASGPPPPPTSNGSHPSDSSHQPHPATGDFSSTVHCDDYV